MVSKSTIVILIGVVFLFIPIPPIATIIGIVTILIGAALKLLGGS
jgi:xanthosine utilization system XapX-like protein